MTNPLLAFLLCLNALAAFAQTSRGPCPGFHQFDRNSKNWTWVDGNYKVHSYKQLRTPDGHIFDTDRVMFLRNYLTQLHRAVSEGVPVKGYFLWSLMDNYEWADGYQNRFGIHYVDFKTQKRTPKLSAHFYKEVIARNGLA